MKKWKSWKICILIAACVLINMMGKQVAVLWKLPMWFDALGTCIAAYVFGPFCGAIVGMAGHAMYGFEHSVAFLYSLVGAAVGITAGVCFRKNMMKSFYGAFTVSMIITVVATVVVTPITLMVNDKIILNMWGNGVMQMLMHYGLGENFSTVVGLLFIDVLDKLVTVMIIYAGIAFKRKHSEMRRNHRNLWNITQNHLGHFIMVLTVIAAVNVLPVSGSRVMAADEGLDSGSYMQTLYNADNGFISGKANDIEQTKDGFLWIATYDGLYQYDGTNFNRMQNLASVKSVNCLYADVNGRLWIGTNDDGVAVLVNDKIVGVLNVHKGLDTNSVRCIGEDGEGNYYIGTSGALSIASIKGGISVVDSIPEISYASSIASYGDYVAVVTNGGRLFILRNGQIVTWMDSNVDGEDFHSCTYDDKGGLYVGTSTNTIYRYEVVDDKLQWRGKVIANGIKCINSLQVDDTGYCYVCSDSGIGYADKNNKFHYVNTAKFSSSIEDMLIDYQGNQWYVSSRLGLLKVSKSEFTDIYQRCGLSEQVVNSVTMWQGRLYCGTDQGLDIIDLQMNTAIEDLLHKSLIGQRIRCVKVDSHNHLWICAYGKDGLLEVTPDGTITKYSENVETGGRRYRSIIELDNGEMLAATDSGLVFIKYGNIIATLGTEDGLENAKILSLLQLEDGTIWAGSDGNGIAVIKDHKIVDTIDRMSGLNSGVIMQMVPCEEGILIVSGNSISLMNENGKIRSLDNFPFYNNYRITVDHEGKAWVSGSSGLCVVSMDQLLSGRKVNYQLFNKKTGLKGAIVSNAWDYVDNKGNLYLCCDTGCNSINLYEQNTDATAYRLLVKQITADDVEYKAGKNDVLLLASETKKVEFYPVLLNYTMDDPYISYYMDGFDSNPIIVRHSELGKIVYTNLESGRYVFHISVLDGDTYQSIATSSYTVEIEKKIYEYVWFNVYVIFVGVLIVIWITWSVTRFQLGKTLRDQETKLKNAKRQAEMGNETILAIAKTVDAKDGNTSQHSERVSEYSVLIAKRLGMSDADCENLRQIALLHDIGKIGIPDSILNKPARLTDEEFAIMKSHVTIGAQILKDFTIVDHVMDGVSFHHERYDGRGYMKGLKRDEIPLNARIIGIADAFDAMTSNRVYRKQLDFDYVLGELKKGRGTQFDPYITDIMLELINDGTIDIKKRYEQEGNDEKN